MKFTELPEIGKPLAEGIFAGITSTKKGPTPLIAAMRCFCHSKLGNEVEIPKELT